MYEKIKDRDADMCYFDFLEFSEVTIASETMTITFCGPVEMNYKVICNYNIERGSYEIILTTLFSEEFTEKHFNNK